MAAWAIGGATIGSAIIGGIGAKKAADAGQEGAANAIAEEGRQFDPDVVQAFLKVVKKI